MAIRTNTTTWFRTTYTGSSYPISMGANTLAEGNYPMTNTSSSQWLYFSEPSRSFKDVVFNGSFNSADTTQFLDVYMFVAVHSDPNLHCELTAPPERAVFGHRIAYGTTADPYGIMGIWQQTSSLAGNTSLISILNASASTDNLYWTNAYTRPGAGNLPNGSSFKMSTTYQYDDFNLEWHTKTVRIPINSLVGNAICGTTMQILDNTGSIPALDTWLPEASKSYKDIVVEFYAFTALNAASNISLTYNIDNGQTFTGETYWHSANGGVFSYDTWRLNTASFDTSVSHSIYVGSTLANTFSNLGAILNVTYTYHVPSTTRVMNSLIMTGVDDDGTMQTSTLPTTYHKKLLITAPGTINLRQSGFLLFTGCAATQTVSFKCGAQNYINYRLLQGSVNSGNYPIIHRIDSTSTGSAALTLTRGYNDIETYWYANAVNVVSGLSGMLILNYESDKSEQGVGAHAHTIAMTMTGSTAIGQQLSFLWPSSSFIPESNYYILSASPVVYRFTSTAIETSQLYAFYTGSEGPTNDGTGYINLGTTIFRSDAEVGTRITTGRYGDYIKRYPQDPDDTLIDIQTRRRYLLQNVGNTVYSSEMLLTYRSLTFPVSGSILNYSGDGRMSIRVLDVDRNEIILDSSSSVGGIINEVWYEDINNLQVIAYNSSSYAVSNIIPAGTGSFTINFASGGSTEHSYTFIG